VKSLEKFQLVLLRAGLMISAVLLIRFAVDFDEQMSWWLAAPFWLLVIVTLAVGTLNSFGGGLATSGTSSNTVARILLVGAIPLGFFASSLDCTGLSVHGCSPFCTFVKVFWIPLIAIACLFYWFTRARGWLTAIIVMSFVPLVPHCVCYNVGNGWWIDRLGVSPLCYGWGFAVSSVAVASLRSARLYWASLAVSYSVIAGASAFFVAHHYFQFPW
jgi:hypothetical protein